MKLSEYERSLLHHLNGEDVPGLMWGAAMSEAIETLYSAGYASRTAGRYKITEAGRAALESEDKNDAN